MGRKKVAVVVGTGRIGSAVRDHLRAKDFHVITFGHGQLELRDIGTISRLFSTVPLLDVLVNAAGAYGAVGKVRDVPPHEWRKAGDICLTGVYACCHYAIPKMPTGSHIITFAGGGRGALEMRSGLACAKSGINRLTQTLAAEEPDLHVNDIAPGPMYSRMHDPIMGLDTPWAAEFRDMRDRGLGEVPVEWSLNAMDHIFRSGITGKLVFARDFYPRASDDLVARRNRMYAESNEAAHATATEA